MFAPRVDFYLEQVSAAENIAEVMVVSIRKPVLHMYHGQVLNDIGTSTKPMKPPKLTELATQTNKANQPKQTKQTKPIKPTKPTKLT